MLKTTPWQQAAAVACLRANACRSRLAPMSTAPRFSNHKNQPCTCTPHFLQIYGWPLGLTPKWRRLVDPYKAAAWKLLQRCLGPLRCGGRGGRRCACWRWRRQASDDGVAASAGAGAGIEVVHAGLSAVPAAALSARARTELETPVHTLSAL